MMIDHHPHLWEIVEELKKYNLPAGGCIYPSLFSRKLRMQNAVGRSSGLFRFLTTFPPHMNAGVVIR